MFGRGFCIVATTCVVLAAPATAAGPTISAGAEATAPADRGEEQVQVDPPPAAPTARYRVTLAVDWTGATHPTTLPGNAHVSAPVLAVHSTPGAVFTSGGQASAGVEQMAETGSTSTLVAELSGNAQVAIVRTAAGVPAPAVGSRTFDIDVDQSTHLISAVTMLAPSPDWFVGFADSATFVDGQWITSQTFPLRNYDAGTDSGATFTAGNSDTRPQQPISGPGDAAFSSAAAEGAFGTVTITKIG